MAFKLVQKKTFVDAIPVESLKKKPLIAYLIKVGFTKKKKGRNVSALYLFEKEDGTRIQLWGCADLNAALLGTTELPIKEQPDSINMLHRITFQGLRKIPGRPKPMKQVMVEIDDTNTYSDATDKAVRGTLAAMRARRKAKKS